MLYCNPGINYQHFVVTMNNLHVTLRIIQNLAKYDKHEQNDHYMSIMDSALLFLDKTSQVQNSILKLLEDEFFNLPVRKRIHR